MAIASFFEHFEGKDWLTAALSMTAIVISFASIWHNRWANRMRELSEQAAFTATWRPHERDGMSQLDLENVGHASAEGLAVQLPYDPSHILGLEGTVNSRLAPGDIAVFTIRQDKDEMTHLSLHKDLSLILTWRDQWGRPRMQKISEGRRWSHPRPEDENDRHPGADAPLDLYDPAPFWSYWKNRRGWKLRQERMPRVDLHD